MPAETEFQKTVLKNLETERRRRLGKTLASTLQLATFINIIIALGIWFIDQSNERYLWYGSLLVPFFIINLVYSRVEKKYLAQWAVIYSLYLIGLVAIMPFLIPETGITALAAYPLVFLVTGLLAGRRILLIGIVVALLSFLINSFFYETAWITPAINNLLDTNVLIILTFFVMSVTGIFFYNIIKEEEQLYRQAQIGRLASQDDTRFHIKNYRTLIDLSPDMVLVTDINGGIQIANPAARDALGQVFQDEIIGRKIWEVIQDKESNAKELFIEKLKQGNGEILTHEFALKKFDSSIFYLEIKASLLRNPQDEWVNLMVVGHDVTLRKLVELRLLDEKGQLQETIRENDIAYQNLVENSSQGMMLYQGNRVVQTNQAFADLCAIPLEELYEAKVENLAHLIHPEDVGELLHYIQENLKENSPLRHETRLLLKDGQVRWIEFILNRFQFMGKPAYQLTAQDRTLRKLAEQARQVSEERYRALAEAAHDQIFIINPTTGVFEYLNQYAAKSLGGQPDELIGKPVSTFFRPEEIKIEQEHLNNVWETGNAANFEEQKTLMGQQVWLSTSLVRLNTAAGNPGSVMGVSRNIDHLKKLEASLQAAKNNLEIRVLERTEQLRQLTHQLVSVQENERRYVSRELHDEAGQILAGLKYRLGEAISSLTEDQTEVKRRIQAGLDAANEAMQKIRTLSHNLRPPAIDVAGVNLALQSYCAEFSRNNHLSVKYKGTELPELDPEAGLSLYRILQEALNNIQKHAHATQVDVVLKCQKNKVLLTITDNGVGFNQPAAHDGIGILGMRERLSLFDGTLEIESSPGKGTKLKAQLLCPVTPKES